MTIEGGPRIVGDWSETTLNYQVTVERYPNLKEELAIGIPTVKSPLYLMENLQEEEEEEYWVVGHVL